MKLKIVKTILLIASWIIFINANLISRDILYNYGIADKYFNNFHYFNTSFFITGLNSLNKCCGNINSDSFSKSNDFISYNDETDFESLNKKVIHQYTTRVFDSQKLKSSYIHNQRLNINSAGTDIPILTSSLLI